MPGCTGQSSPRCNFVKAVIGGGGKRMWTVLGGVGLNLCSIT